MKELLTIMSSIKIDDIDISRGRPYSYNQCALAQSLMRQGFTLIEIDYYDSGDVRISADKYRYRDHNPDLAEWLANFDNGVDVSSCSFRLD